MIYEHFESAEFGDTRLRRTETPKSQQTIMEE